ncbi:hypothetical protein EC991_002776 [Linnemannia zychae]|nr:hypothetical protein EC991_002776 [Linnemannia zychae]
MQFKITTSIILLATVMAVQTAPAPIIHDPSMVTITDPVAQAQSQSVDTNTQIATTPKIGTVMPMMPWDTNEFANAATADNETDHDYDDGDNAKWGGGFWNPWCWGGWGNSWPWGWGGNWGNNWWCW